jgi:hypothetical protein
MAKHGVFWAAQPDKTLFNCHYQNKFLSVQ